MSTYTTQIYDLGTLDFALTHPISLQVEEVEGLSEYHVEWPEHEIHGSGATVGEALRNFKKIILGHVRVMQQQRLEILSNPQGLSDFEITLINLVEKM